VIIADPEIWKFKIQKEMDFVLLACDGIFDKCTSAEVIQCVWEGVLEDWASNVHEQCGRAVDKILKTSVAKKTMDNITVVFVAFEGFNTRGFKQITKSSTGSSADLDLVVDEDKDSHSKGMVHSIFHKTPENCQFVIDMEEMKTIHYPS